MRRSINASFVMFEYFKPQRQKRANPALKCFTLRRVTRCSSRPRGRRTRRRRATRTRIRHRGGNLSPKPSRDTVDATPRGTQSQRHRQHLHHHLPTRRRLETYPSNERAHRRRHRRTRRRRSIARCERCSRGTWRESWGWTSRGRRASLAK